MELVGRYIAPATYEVGRRFECPIGGAPVTAGFERAVGADAFGESSTAAIMPACRLVREA